MLAPHSTLLLRSWRWLLAQVFPHCCGVLVLIALHNVKIDSNPKRLWITVFVES